MTISAIVILISSSSVISAGLTLLFQLVFKKVDFKNDFRKEIIKRRIEAYQRLEPVIWELSILVQDGQNAFPRILSGSEFYCNIQVKLGNQNIDNMWLSSDLNSKLTEFNVYLNNIENHHQPKKEEDFKQMGILYLEEIREFRKHINTIFEKDFFEIDKVRKFQKSKAKDLNQEFGVIKKNKH